MSLVLHERGPGGPGGRSTRALSLAKLTALPGKRVVDLGCKEGYNSFDVLECGAEEVVGVEIRDRFLADAEAERSRLGLASVRFVKGDVREIEQIGLGHFDICLCTGLLYHMQNPFNVLKRIRNICSSLMLETHIDPGTLSLPLVERKYRQFLGFLPTSVVLDGHRFTGRLKRVPLEQEMSATSGSISHHTSFWPDRASLRRMLEAAEFTVTHEIYGGLHEGILIDHGVRRAKIIFFATV